MSRYVLQVKGDILTVLRKNGLVVIRNYSGDSIRMGDALKAESGAIATVQRIFEENGSTVIVLANNHMSLDEMVKHFKIALE